MVQEMAMDVFPVLELYTCGREALMNHRLKCVQTEPFKCTIYAHFMLPSSVLRYTVKSLIMYGAAVH